MVVNELARAVVSRPFPDDAGWDKEIPARREWAGGRRGDLVPPYVNNPVQDQMGTATFLQQHDLSKEQAG